MARKTKNSWSLLIIAIIFLAIIGSNSAKKDETKANITMTTTQVSNNKTEEVKSENDVIKGELKVHFIDVGQADSILVQQGNQTMLIDAGNNSDDKTIKTYLDNQGVKTIDYLIGTHPHEDHIGAMDYVINSFKVGKIYMPKKTSTTKTFEDVVNATKAKGLKFTVPVVGDSFKLGEATCTILGPVKEYENVNDNSIVIKVTFGENTFLFTGDAEATAEMDMVNSGNDLSAQLLKAAHHGSKTSTCANFLEKVNPKYSVVSVGKTNDYGHPNQGTLNRLKDKEVILYRTDECGTIVATSNGKEIKFDKESGSYNGKENTENGKKKTSTNLSNSSNSKTPNNNSNAIVQQNNESKVWLPATGNCYHSINNCGKMNPNKATQVTLEEAKGKGYSPCNKCKP